MKTIQIDDAVYEHLLKNAIAIGEDASSILKRLLRISSSLITGSINDAKAKVTFSRKSLSDLVQDPRFLRERDAVGKFLFILSWLSKEHRTDFRKVFAVRGRKRQYFADSASALEDEGTSVNPQRIPDSPYWVVTNNDTPKKQRMIVDAMRVLGYPSREADGVADLLE